MEEDLTFKCPLELSGWSEEILIDFFIKTISECDPYNNGIENLIAWLSKGRPFHDLAEGQALYKEFLNKIYQQIFNYRTDLMANQYAHAFILYVYFYNHELQWTLSRQPSSYNDVRWDYKAIKFK